MYAKTAFVGLATCFRNRNTFFKSFHPTPWRDSISRPKTPIPSLAGGDDTTRPRRQGLNELFREKKTLKMVLLLQREKIKIGLFHPYDGSRPLRLGSIFSARNGSIRFAS
jgi:hypothetical protein